MSKLSLKQIYKCRTFPLYTKELRRAMNKVGAPSMVQTTISILVVNMFGPIVHNRGPLFTAPWICGYAILKKLTFSTPREVVVWCLHFNVPE